MLNYAIKCGNLFVKGPVSVGEGINKHYTWDLVEKEHATTYQSSHNAYVALRTIQSVPSKDKYELTVLRS